MSYKHPGGKHGYMGVAFQILDFLADKFNFTYNVTESPVNKFGSTDDMAGSLIETINKTVIDKFSLTLIAFRNSSYEKFVKRY